MKASNIFIAIDDDPVNNLLSKIIIKKAVPEATVFDFTKAEKALEFLINESENHEEIILFLDINMPIMDGWGFLERFEKLDAEITSKVEVYMLSSSLDEKDVTKAKSYKSVTDYLAKPLTIEGTQSICSKNKAA